MNTKSPAKSDTVTSESQSVRRRITPEHRYRTLITNLCRFVNAYNVHRLCDQFDVPDLTREIISESEDIGGSLFMYIEGQNIISSDDVSYLEKNFRSVKEYGAVRLIREYHSEVHGRPNLQGSKHENATELPSLDPYDVLLYNLSKYINRENMMRLLPKIGVNEKEQLDVLDSINPGLEIFKHLDQKNKISRKDISYLRETFEEFHHEQALNSLEKYERETGQENGFSENTTDSPEIQPFTFLLYNLSQCISKQIINQIIASQHIDLWITKSKWDSIMTSNNPTIEFIKHLEKRRLITRRDISLLKKLFQQVIVAVVFLNQYETEIQMSKSSDGTSVMSPAGIDAEVDISAYSFLLYNLSRCITSAAVEKLLDKEFYSFKERWDIMQSGSPSVAFVKYLEQINKISRSNVSYLEQALRSSNLYIAAQYVVQYQLEMAREQSQSFHLKYNFSSSRFTGSIFPELQRKIGIDNMVNDGPLNLEKISKLTTAPTVTLEINLKNLTAIFFSRILSNDLRAFSVFRTFFRRSGTHQKEYQFSDLGASSSNCFSTFSSTSSDVSCRDALYAIFLSCDFNVRVLLILKMASLQFAVPILLPRPGGDRPAMTTFMELYHLKFTWCEKKKLKEGSVVNYPFPTVAVVKYGENELSKSSVINTMLGKVQSSMGHDFFLVSREDNVRSEYSQGIVEAVWYLPFVDTYQSNTSLNEAMCVMNLRGCCNDFNLSPQRDFLFQFATVVIAFIDNDNLAMNYSRLHELSNQTIVIVVVTFSSSERYASPPTIVREDNLQLLVCRGCNELRIAEEICKLLRQLLQSEKSSKKKTIAGEGVDINKSLGFETITQCFI